MSYTVEDRIHKFMDRKSRQYPDLKLLERWGDYETTPIREQH